MPKILLLPRPKDSEIKNPSNFENAAMNFVLRPCSKVPISKQIVTPESEASPTRLRDYFRSTY